MKRVYTVCQKTQANFSMNLCVNIILVNLLDSDWLKAVPIKH
jgi:hypothetical protein